MGNVYWMSELVTLFNNEPSALTDQKPSVHEHQHTDFIELLSFLLVSLMLPLSVIWDQLLVGITQTPVFTCFGKLKHKNMFTAYKYNVYSIKKPICTCTLKKVTKTG